MPIQDPGNIPGQVETHAVASEQACRDMLKKFQQQGRKLKLEIRQQPGDLPYLCVFKGQMRSLGITTTIALNKEKPDDKYVQTLRCQ